MTRTEALAAIFVRAGRRRVFGFDSQTGRGGEITEAGDVLPGWWPASSLKGPVDVVCIEGEPLVRIPAERRART